MFCLIRWLNIELANIVFKIPVTEARDLVQSMVVVVAAVGNIYHGAHSRQKPTTTAALPLRLPP